jgi:hypothetical protein
MRTVNIGVLKNQLSAYLRYVRNGEEVVVRDRNVPSRLKRRLSRLLASGGNLLGRPAHLRE